MEKQFENGWLVAACDQFQNAKQSLVYAIKALDASNCDFAATRSSVLETIGDLECSISRINEEIKNNAQFQPSPENDIDVIRAALRNLPENKKLVISLENMEQLIKDATKFFSPTHNFDGEKEEWMKKAGLCG